MKQTNSLLPQLYKTKYFVLLILAVAVFVVVYQLHFIIDAQQQAQSLEVSPPSQEVKGNPGETVTVKAKVRNGTSKPLPIDVHVEDFTAEGEEGQVALTTGGGNYSVVGWTKVEPESFTLQGGEEQEVTATISIPEGSAGGRYGSFVFGVRPEKPTEQAAAVAQQIASLFLLRVNGPVKESMTIPAFDVPKFSEFGPVVMTMKFNNTGNVHNTTYGLVNITDMFGNKQADIVVKGTNVFPGATRNVDVSFNKVFLFGKYTATATMYYGATQPDTLSATTTFYVFPIRLIGAVLVILVILFLMRKRIRKAFKALGGK